MSRSLDDLDPRFLPLAAMLIARCAEAGIPVMVINTMRTKTEQQAALAAGFSSTMRGKHLPQPPSGKSLAIDICPYSQYDLTGPDKLQWNSADPVWLKIGLIGEALGLRWGGRWKQPHDPGHFELNIT